MSNTPPGPRLLNSTLFDKPPFSTSAFFAFGKPASSSGMDAVHSEFVHNGGIALGLMLHSEVHGFGEERSGVTNPATRHKLQNRSNQRAYSQYIQPDRSKCTPLTPIPVRRQATRKQAKVHERLTLREAGIVSSG